MKFFVVVVYSLVISWETLTIDYVIIVVAFYISNQTLVVVDLLTSLHLHCHIWTTSMQLGQLQP